MSSYYVLDKDNYNSTKFKCSSPTSKDRNDKIRKKVTIEMYPEGSLGHCLVNGVVVDTKSIGEGDKGTYFYFGIPTQLVTLLCGIFRSEINASIDDMSLLAATTNDYTWFRNDIEDLSAVGLKNGLPISENVDKLFSKNRFSNIKTSTNPFGLGYLHLEFSTVTDINYTFEDAKSSLWYMECTLVSFNITDTSTFRMTGSKASSIVFEAMKGIRLQDSVFGLEEYLEDGTITRREEDDDNDRNEDW